MTKIRKTPLPPRLSMDEYAAFLSESWAHIDPEKAKRQKALEKVILKPFKWVPEPILP